MSSPQAQLGVRTTDTFCCSTEVHPHAGVLPCTVTLKVFAANPGAAKRRSYLPGVPGTAHDVVTAPALHWTEPDTAPESVTVTPGTGPPLAEDTPTTMAIGRGHGGLRQSGFVGPLHPIHAPRTTATPKTPRRRSVIAFAKDRSITPKLLRGKCRLEAHLSLLSQGRHWIDAKGAPSRYVAGTER